MLLLSALRRDSYTLITFPLTSMRRISSLALAGTVLATGLIAACSFGARNDGSTTSSSASSEVSNLSASSESALATKNVSYQGIIEVLGPSVYQEGTHKLVLADKSFIILKASDANLELASYLGKRVEVRGSVQPTVEAGGTIMSVEEVTILDVTPETSSSSEAEAKKFAICGGIAGRLCETGFTCVDDPSDSCDPTTGGADCSGICIPSTAEKTSSSVQSSSVANSKASSSVKPIPSTSSVSSSSSKSSVTSSSASLSSSASSQASNSAELEQQIVQMAKQQYAQDSLWTQKYCTSHIAFCIPVHKNWYFKSFGATTSNLWHVEFGISNIDVIGQGTIALHLVNGTLSSLGLADGQVRVQGKDVVAFKEWKDGAHFEIIADARLQAAVSYMVSHITEYNPGE